MLTRNSKGPEPQAPSQTPRRNQIKGQLWQLASSWSRHPQYKYAVHLKQIPEPASWPGRLSGRERKDPKLTSFSNDDLSASMSKTAGGSGLSVVLQNSGLIAWFSFGHTVTQLCVGYLNPRD